MADNSEINKNAIQENQTRFSAIPTPSEKIEELRKVLDNVTNKYNKHGHSLKANIAIWGSICFLLIVAGCILACYLFHVTFPDKWTWQIVYITAIRITIISAFLALFSFCAKILKSYIHMNEKNNHCRTIIDSMAYIVGSAIGEVQRDMIYNKLIDIITNQENAGLINKSDDFKSGAISLDVIEKTLNLIKKD